MSSKQPILHPYFVTGFSDAESYFYIGINRSTKMNTGWSVNLQFGINLHKKDRYLLELIKAILNGVGNIFSQEKENIQYIVSSIKDLQVIVDHFNKFPLITKKSSDFQLFKYAFELVKSKKHLTFDGLILIVSIKALMNKGLSDKLKLAFPKLNSIVKPLKKNPKIKDPNWLSGFVSGEGNFYINIINAKTKVRKQVFLMFTITQHSRDADLLKYLSKCEYFLRCGSYYPRYNREEGNFVVAKFSDIKLKIIPFF